MIPPQVYGVNTREKKRSATRWTRSFFSQVRSNLCIFQERRKWKRAVPKGRGDGGEAEEMQSAGAAGAVAAWALGVGEAAHGREHPSPVPHGQCLRLGLAGAKGHFLLHCFKYVCYGAPSAEERSSPTALLTLKEKNSPLFWAGRGAQAAAPSSDLASVSSPSQQPESPTWIFITFPKKVKYFCCLCWVLPSSLPQQLYSSLLWIGFEDCGFNNRFYSWLRGHETILILATA